MGCGGNSPAKSSTPIQDAARQAVAQQVNPSKMSIKHWDKDLDNPFGGAPLKQPSPYSGVGGAYMGIDRVTMPGYPVDAPAPTLPIAKVFRPIAPPLPEATVTLTLTETQAAHLKQLLGAVGQTDDKPAIFGWYDNKPRAKVIRASTDAIYYALSAAKV